MFQWNGKNLQTFVFVNTNVLVCIDRMKYHFIRHTIAMVIYQRLKKCFDILWTIHVEWGSTSQQSECGDESHQSEAMVPMQMRDENIEEPIQMDVVSSEFHLCPLRTIHEKVFLPYVHHHAAPIVLHGR